MICVLFGTSQKLAAYSYIWWLMQSESSQVSTGPQFWKLSLPYTSASCTSHQECGCYFKQHFTANFSAVFPLSFPLHHLFTYVRSYPTNTSFCYTWHCVASFSGSSPPFCHILKKNRERAHILYKENGERAWSISSCVQWHTMCVFLYVVWIIELLPMHAVIERSTMLETESPCWLSQHLMLLNMTGGSPWEATTNKCESCHAEKWPWKLPPPRPLSLPLWLP